MTLLFDIVFRHFPPRIMQLVLLLNTLESTREFLLQNELGMLKEHSLDVLVLVVLDKNSLVEGSDTRRHAMNLGLTHFYV